jgi:hypothetical protein
MPPAAPESGRAQLVCPPRRDAMSYCGDHNRHAIVNRIMEQQISVLLAIAVQLSNGLTLLFERERKCTDGRSKFAVAKESDTCSRSSDGPTLAARCRRRRCLSEVHRPLADRTGAPLGRTRTDRMPGSTPEQLLAQLSVQQLDVVLSDAPIAPGVKVRAYNHLLGETGVSFLGDAKLARTYRRRFPKSLRSHRCNSRSVLRHLGGGQTRASGGGGDLRSGPA